MTLYKSVPKYLATMNCDVQEYFSYQYLPIKMADDTEIHGNLEPRLHCFKPLLAKIICHFVADYGVTRYVKSYVYVTAKNRFITPKHGYNRQGYHIDGFGSNDINFIWSNNCPTVFNSGEFYLSDDDKLSMDEMEEQALECNEFTYPNCSLLRLDNTVVHKTADIKESCVRAFLKVSFSTQKYDLLGNSHNYLINYNWLMRPRNIERNVPQEIELI